MLFDFISGFCIGFMASLVLCVLSAKYIVKREIIKQMKLKDGSI